LGRRKAIDVKLSQDSYDWSLKHLIREHDTDLFPLPFEIEAIESQWNLLGPEFAHLDVTSYTWRGGRRFVVPKGHLAFRLATQLDPIDSVVISALVYEYGGLLESSRLPTTDECVFSYRFAPDEDGRLYSKAQAWHDFWRMSKQKAASRPTGSVLVTDISDCYNQIYHHVLERHFAAAGLPTPVSKVLQRYLQTLTDKGSRGVPVGPHTSHILAECALDSLDRSLKSHGYDHCRYVDDIHIFVDDETSALGALYDLTQILDSQQLIVQKEKTRILSAIDFQALADEMLLDRPINQREAEVLEVIARETNNDPYAEVSLATLAPADLTKLRRDVLEDLIAVYLNQHPVDYSRLAWLIRRLTQVGASGALEMIISRMESLGPILGPVARYVMAAVPNYDGDHAMLGGALVRALDLPIIGRSPYLQMVLLNVMATIPGLNHIDRLTARYPTADPIVRRGILLAAASGKRSAWLRDRKAGFRTMDAWSRRAFIEASAVLPHGESKFWLDSVRDSLRPLERVVAKHALPGSKVGDIKIVQE
jgi:hypothetical protein